MNKDKLTELVKKSKAKDNAAIEELYKGYYADVLYICRKYSLNDADSADVAQETFIKAFQSINELENAEKFPAWLSRIATNKCINLLKHNKTLVMDTVSTDETVLDIPDNAKSSEDVVIDKEISDILLGMIEKLPVEQRVTIFMYYYQDYSIKEIAKFYGCSENTVKSRLNYAKKTMRIEAEKLENNGVKLRVVAVLPFLFALFANERKVFACEIPSSTTLISNVMSSASGVASGVSKAGFLTTVACKVTVGIAVAAVVAGGVIAGVSLSKSDNGKSNGSGNIISSETTLQDENNTTSDKTETETPTKDAPSVKDGEFEVVELDRYTDVNDSRYMSLVLHNPESTAKVGSKTDATKPIVIVYDMESSLKSAFDTPFDNYVTINDYIYRYAVAGDKYAVYDARSSADFLEGFTHIVQYESKVTDAGEKYLSWVPHPDRENRCVLDYFSTENEDIDFEYNQETTANRYIADENVTWYTFASLKDGLIDKIYVRVANDDDYNYFVYVPLKTPITYGEDTIAYITEKLDELCAGYTCIAGSLKGDIVAEETFGTAYTGSLNDTVFYQDIVASKISENYGLNLKNKMNFYWTEASYIEYLHSNNTNGVSLKFKYDGEDYEYEDYLSFSDKNRYEYTDEDGDKYSYFNSKGGVVIFKNEKFTNTKILIGKVDENMSWIGAISQLFGIKA